MSGRATPTPTSSHSVSELYRAHAETMRNMAFGVLLDSDAAEDAVQEVFRKLPSDFVERVGRDSRAAYLTRAAVNEARRIAMSVPTTVRIDERRAVGVAWCRPRLPRRLIYRDHRALIARCFRVLSPGQRKALRLTALCGLSRREAARHLGISVEALEKRLTAGYRKMRKLLYAEGIHSSQDVSTFGDGGGVGGISGCMGTPRHA